MIGERKKVFKNTEQYMLNYGGMPELLYLDDKYKKEWLDAYEYTYLEKDLGDLVRLNDLQPFKKLQIILALRSGQIFSYSEVARDSQISIDTVKRYLEYLRISYQVIILKPYYKNITSSVIKSPKVYFTDIGILRQLTNFWGLETGEIYETMIVSEIVKWVKTQKTPVNIFYYRTKSGLEIDLLIETQEGVLGIEIKNKKNVFDKDIRNLKILAEKLGKTWIGGICLNRSDELKIMDTKYDIWSIPSYRFFT